ncbi:hypothetical protein BJ912DRAFT_637740 [Pholiota molesta]|nr:hypothetical protein BJ912DRAFT_637740 [Pholiota molesta]
MGAYLKVYISFLCLSLPVSYHRSHFQGRMNVHSISTDDTSLQHDFDFESLSDMSSPTLSEFSDVVASIDNGVDDLPSPSSDPLDNGITDRDPPVDTLPALDSFVPIIEHLPGLVLENNAYHVRRPLLKAELKQLRSYTRKIRELILTDATSTGYPSVAPETLARLALIQDPKSPFLPSLETLRLVDADEALIYFLFFCVTPSLASLEISHIPRTRHITISCFLEELVLNAPQLSNITLGPGRLSESSLQSSLKFVHLRHLHIINAADSLDFDFLRDVSSLPELESFVIDARTAEYQQRLFQSDAASLAPTSSTEGPASFVEYQTPIAADIDSATPFRRLTTLSIIANVVLMGDLVYHLFPQGVKEVSLTLVQNGLSLHLPSHWDKKRPDVPAAAQITMTDTSAQGPEQSSISQNGVDVSLDNRSDPEGLPFDTTTPFPDSISTTFAQPPAVVDPSVVAQEVILILEHPIAPIPESYKPKGTGGKKKSIMLRRQKERARREKEEERIKAEEERERLEVAREAQEREDQERREDQEWREEQERISNIISQTAFFAYVIEEILTLGNPDAFTIDRLEMQPLAFDPIPSSIEFPSPTFRTSVVKAQALQKSPGLGPA